MQENRHQLTVIFEKGIVLHNAYSDNPHMRKNQTALHISSIHNKIHGLRANVTAHQIEYYAT